MKQKNLIMLGVAVGCGLIAAIAVAKLSAGGNRGPETVQLLVAKKDIPIDTTIDDKNMDLYLGMTDVPKHLVPLDPVDSVDAIKGKSNTRTLKAGNAITISDFGMNKKIQIPDGLKHITFQVTATDGVEGFAKPGSKVDVHYIEKTQSGKTRSAIILRDMLVLAVGRVAENSEKQQSAIEQVQSVSLGVTDEQASMISHAEKKGTLKLVLRSVPLTEAEKLAQGKIIWINDPFDTPAEPKPTPVVEAPKAPEREKLETVVVVKEAVPANTLVNVDTVRKYFDTMEVRRTPPGAVASTTELLGKFIVKQLDPGQHVFKSATGDKAVEISEPKKPVDPPLVVEKKPEPEPKPEKPFYPRTYQTIVQGGRFVTIVWLEIAPGQYKSFESDEAADKYNPNDEKKDEKKPAGSPAGN
jgi:pilus assembly protein CpaB